MELNLFYFDLHDRKNKSYHASFWQERERYERILIENVNLPQIYLNHTLSIHKNKLVKTDRQCLWKLTFQGVSLHFKTKKRKKKNYRDNKNKTFMKTSVEPNTYVRLSLSHHRRVALQMYRDRVTFASLMSESYTKKVRDC